MLSLKYVGMGCAQFEICGGGVCSVFNMWGWGVLLLQYCLVFSEFIVFNYITHILCLCMYVQSDWRVLKIIEDQ